MSFATGSTAISPTRISGVRRRFSYLRLGHLLRGLAGLLDRTHHVEGLLGHVVALSIDDLLEASDRVRDLHVAPLEPRELLRDDGEAQAREERDDAEPEARKESDLAPAEPAQSRRDSTMHGSPPQWWSPGWER